MSFFLLSNNITKAARRSGSSRLARLVLGSLKKALNWRMNNHCFHWPLELWLLKRRHGIALRRSLLTGQALGHSLKEAC